MRPCRTLYPKGLLETNIAILPPQTSLGSGRALHHPAPSNNHFFRGLQVAIVKPFNNHKDEAYSRYTVKCRINCFLRRVGSTEPGHAGAMPLCCMCASRVRPRHWISGFWYVRILTARARAICLEDSGTLSAGRGEWGPANSRLRICM